MREFDMFAGWGGMWFGPVFMFLVPLLVIMFFIWAIGSLVAKGSSRRSKLPTAREILDERFAKGDIDQEEYQRRRDALDH